MGYDTGAAGGSANVQGTAQAPTYQDGDGLAGAMRQITGSGANVIGPNAAAYNSQMNQAGNNASYFQTAGQNYKQAGPTISNPNQAQSQGDLGNLQKSENGFLSNGSDYNTAIQNAETSSTDQSIAAQMAMARSTQGGAASQAGAMRNAQENAAMQTQQGANQAAQLGSQMALQERGQNAGVLGQQGYQLLGQYGLEQQQAIAQGQLDSTNQSQQNAMQLGLYGLGQGAFGQAQNSLNSYTQGNLAAQGQQETNNDDATKTGTQLASGVVGAAAAASDIRAKQNIRAEGKDARLEADARALSGAVDDQNLAMAMRPTAIQKVAWDKSHPQQNAADAFMQTARPYTYDYKNPGLNGGQRRLGPMAQDLEQGPTGPDLVKDTPGGKVVDTSALSLANAGAAGRLYDVTQDHDQRLAALEQQQPSNLSGIMRAGQDPSRPQLAPMQHGIVSAYDGQTMLPSDTRAKKSMILEEGRRQGAAGVSTPLPREMAPDDRTSVIKHTADSSEVNDAWRRAIVAQSVPIPPATVSPEDTRLQAERAAYNAQYAHPFGTHGAPATPVQDPNDDQNLSLPVGIPKQEVSLADAMRSRR